MNPLFWWLNFWTDLFWAVWGVPFGHRNDIYAETVKRHQRTVER